MGYIYSIQTPDNTTHLIEPLLFATAGGTIIALTAEISNFTLVAGACVNIKVGEVGSNATLNVSSTGAKDIYYNNMQIGTNMLTPDNIYTFIYDGSHWNILGDITSITIKTSSPLTGGSNTPTTTTGTYTLGIDTSGLWSGTATKATKADITSTKWGISYYSDTTGTFKSTGAGAAGNVFIGSGDADPTWYAGLSLTGAGTQQSPYDANFSNTVTITGASTLSSTLSVASTSTLTGNVTIGDNSHASTLTVFGAATLKNIASIIGNTTIGNASTASTLDVYGATALYSTLDVTGATTLDSTLNVTGNTIIGNNQTTSTLDVYGSVSLYDTLSVTDATTLSSTLEVVGTTKLIDNVGIGDDPESGANAHALYVSGTTLLVGDVDITGNIEITGDILPSTTNTYTLGSANSSNNNTDNGQRWKGVYIGTDDTYGDPYTPVYWNDGTPETVAPIQYIDFSITGILNEKGVKLTSSAITTNSYVLEIVVTDGISYLTSPIEWSTFTEQSNGNTVVGIKLECATPPDDIVEGYIIIARGTTDSPTSTGIYLSN